MAELSVFNNENTEWKEGKYSLFLGQSPALYDSINTTFPKIFNLYKQQKASDWSEDELSLEQSRVDMLTCPQETKDLMIKNLSLQWELDSVASRSIAPLFAPFITNSEYWAAVLKVSEIEVLHALTYSEIVRQCIPNPTEIFEQIMGNEQIMGRMYPVAKAFSDLKEVGAKYTLGMLSKEEAYPTLMMALVALYGLERIQFVASFAATFAVVELGWFQDIGKLVQKIMQDERLIHAELDKMALQIEFSTERGKKWLQDNKKQVEELLDSIRNAEHTWKTYLFSEGRKAVGFTEHSLGKYIDYEAQEVYDVCGIDVDFGVKKNPLKYMDNWLDLNKTQNAQQEADSANYSLNIIVDDVGDMILEF